jgi:hypothetical protein
VAQDPEDDEEDFARLLEQSLQAKRYREGDSIEGRVVAIGEDVAFVDVGGKGEATIDLAELKDADGKLQVGAGDRVKAIVVSTAGGLKLSHRLARQAATREALRTHSNRDFPSRAGSKRPSRAATRSVSPASARSVRYRRSIPPIPRIPGFTSAGSISFASSSTRREGRAWWSRGARSSKRRSASRQRRSGSSS